MLLNYFFTRLSVKVRTIFTFILAGLSLGLGFFVDTGWPLGLLGVYLFLVAISKVKTFGLAVLGSYLTWVINIGFATSIFWSIYPIEWIDLGLGRLELVVIGAKWMITTAVLATGGVVFGTFFWLVRKHFSEAYILTIPLIWLLAEISQSFIYSVFVLGPGVGVNVSNSVGYVGYLMGTHPWFLLISKVGGVYALSLFGTVLMTTLWFFSRKLPKRKFVQVVVTLIFATTITTLPFFNNPTNALQGELVAIVQTEFGGSADYSQIEVGSLRQENLNQAVTAALQTGAKYIILPEDSRFTVLVESPELEFRKFRFLNSDPDVVLVDTARLPVSGDEAYLRAYIYDGLAKTLHVADKQYLTPMGEYLPYSYSSVLRAVGLSESARKMNQKLAYRPGPLDTQLDFPDYIPRVLFCFEALNPRGVKDLVEGKKTPFIAHPISHAWFHDSSLLERHLNNTLKIQAVWNNLPIVSSANMAKSNLYTADGQVIPPTIVAEGEDWRVGLVNLPD